MKGRWECLAAAAAAVSLAACGGSPELVDSNGWGGSVDTLGSGRVVVVNPDEPLLNASDGCALQERFRIGALEGAVPDMFGQVRDVALSESGELFVLDVQASEVRVFDAEGRYRLTMGRFGEGPGELNRPAGMAVGPDGVLWVMNWSNARYTAFDPSTGEVVREVRRLASFAAVPWPGLIDDDFRMVDVGLDRDGNPVILRTDTAFVPSDTIPLPGPDPDDVITFRRDGMMVMSTPDPFAAQPFWAPRPHGGLVLGEGERYRLHRVDFDQDTSMTIEVSHEPIRVTPFERDSALTAFRERSELLGGATPDRDPRIPETKPAHGSIFVDDADRTWVRRTPQARGVLDWDVIDSGGRLLCRLPVPDGSGSGRTDVRANRLAFVSEPDGVPTVTVYDLLGMAQ